MWDQRTSTLDRATPSTTHQDHGRLTQHDGIHSSPGTELDHDLRETQGQVIMSRTIQCTRWASPSPHRSPGRMGRDPTPCPWPLLPLPQDLCSRHLSQAQRCCWDTSFSRKKAKLPQRPTALGNHLSAKPASSFSPPACSPIS